MKLSRAVAVAILAACVFAAPSFALRLIDTVPVQPGAKPPQTPTKVTGTVVNQSGKPVANAEVRIYSRPDKPTVVHTNASGAFSYMANPGASMIFVIAPKYAFANTYCQPGKSGPLKITLSPGSTFKGTVVDEAGKPLDGIKVTFEGAWGDGGGDNYMRLPPDLKTVVTGKNGAFAFDHAPSLDGRTCQAQFSIGKPGRATMNESAQKAEIQKGLKFVDPPECVIDGTLYLPGKTGPVQQSVNLLVLLKDWRGYPEMRDGVVDKDGKFHIGGLPPGSATIHMQEKYPTYDRQGHIVTPEPDPWTLPTATKVVLSPKHPATAELTLVTGAIVSGKVTDKQTGKPYSQARLSITHNGRPDPDRPEEAVADENGVFRVRVAPGPVKIGVQQIVTSDKQWIYFQPEEQPEVSFDVADAQDKTDVAVAVDPAAAREYSGGGKPVADDFQLKAGTYDLAWDPDITNSRNYFSQGKYRGKEAEARIRVMPKTVSKRAQCVAMGLDSMGGEGLLFLVFDESKGTGRGWDRVCVDKNRNGDLTDDGPPVEIARRGNGSTSLATPFFEVQARQGPADEQQTEHPYQLSLNVYISGSMLDIMIRSKGGWTGKIDSSKGLVACAVADTTSNGIFCDNSSANEEGDTVYVDDNGSGRVTMLQDYGPQAIHLYKLCQIGKKFYTITPSKVGDKITVEPYTGAVGQILVRSETIMGQKAEADAMSVTSDNGTYSFSNCGGKPISLPVGAYKIESCGLNVGGKLPISCSLSSTVSVTEAKPASVAIGGPLKMAICKSQKNLYFKAGNTEAISWDITIGDKVTLDSIGDSQNPPKVNFYNTKGKLVGSRHAGYT